MPMTTIIPKIKKRIFFAKYGVYRKEVLPRYQSLLLSQRWSREQLEEMNWERRRRLLKYAWEKVPFYREKYGSAGLRPEEIKHPDDFSRLPPLTRRELKDNFRELTAEGIPPSAGRLSTTGGSTGVPVKVLLDRRAPAEAFSWRMLNWWGLDPSMDGAYVWRRPGRGMMARLINFCAWYPTRKLRLDASVMTSRSLDLFLRRFNRMRPALLQGYVGSVNHLALHADRNGMVVHSPRAIWVTASALTAGQRRLIERVFRAPVYEEYGSAEVYWLAAQCRCRDGLHINWEGRYLEFTDDDGRPLPPGEIGKVLITDLENYVFPLIRYENGDQSRALTRECPCGVNLPLMEEVRGRTTDMVRMPDGSVISGAYLTTIFDDFPDAVKAFQIIQQTDLSVILKYVPGLPPSELTPLLGQVREELSRRTNNLVPLVLEEVKDIPHERGKARFVISAAGTESPRPPAEMPLPAAGDHPA